MTNDEAIKVLFDERLCVMRADKCDRQCGKCDLVKEAYDMAINALSKMKFKSLICVIAETYAPYFEILYTDENGNEYIGYSSYDFEIVRENMRKYFGIKEYEGMFIFKNVEQEEK